MPKHDKDINSSKEIQDKGDRKDHKWSVWSQGPKDAKETKRKFKQTTPGQVRDYKHFVNQRRFTKYEQVEYVQHDEEAPVNSVAGGGVDMAPNAKGTKVFMKRRKVDGRTKEYREANRRIKERQEKLAQKQVQAKLDMFGVHANPFVEETENKKYLETKPGSIEDAVLNALNPNAELETLTLPKKNEEEVEEAYKSPLDSPKAKAAREKLQKTLKDIKKKDPDHPAVQNVKEEEVEEGFGKLKDASKNLAKMRKAAGVKVDKQTTTKLPSGSIIRKTTYKKADEEKKSDYLEPDMKKRQANNEKARKDMKKMGTPMKNPHLEQTEIDELSNKTMDSYAQKASASQADAEKKGDYKKADKRMAGKMRASRRKFSNDTNRILNTLKKESKETENGERDAGSDKYTNYTKEMTPGQGITSDDAKKADVRKKKEQAAQQQQLNVDEDMKYLNTKPGSIEEAVLKALMPEAFTTKHEKGDKHDEVPERKAGESEKDHADRKAGRVSFKKPRRSLDAVDPEELKGKHADRKDKDIDNDGDVDSSDQYLHRRRQAIASRRKKEDQKEEVEVTPREKFEQLVAEKRNQLPRQLKDPKKEKMVGTKTGTKVVDRNDPKYKNAPEHESYEPVDELRAPEGRPKWTEKDRKKDAKERYRTDRVRRTSGGTSGRYAKGLGGEPRWWQSTQKDSPHKQSRGVKTKGVKKSSDRLSHATTQSIALRRKLPEESMDEKTIMGVKVKKLKPGKETKDVQTALHRDNKGGITRQQARQKFGPKKVGATAEEKE